MKTIQLFGFIICFFTFACQQKYKKEPENRPFFSLKTFFEKEARALNKKKPRIDKRFIHNDIIQQKSIVIENWEDELEIFRNADINKTAWEKNYHTDSLQKGAYTYINYKTSSDLPIQSIEIVKRKEKIIEIKIARLVNNLLYHASEKLSYSPYGHYRIEKTFQTFFFKKNRYVIDVSVAKIHE